MAYLTSVTLDSSPLLEKKSLTLIPHTLVPVRDMNTEIVLLETLHRLCKWGWRNGSVVKSTCCSYRAPRFSCWHPGGRLISSVSPVPRALVSSLGFFWHQSSMWCTYIHAYWQSIYTHNQKINNFKNNVFSHQMSFHVLRTYHLDLLCSLSMKYFYSIMDTVRLGFVY